MQLKDATDLERRIYEQCLVVEEMPASPEQTALVSTLSEAGHQLQTLRAENAELKRQVEALREDAEVGRSIVKLFSEGHSIFSEHGAPKIVKSGWWKEVRLEDARLLIIEALREAAKGEVG